MPNGTDWQMLDDVKKHIRIASFKEIQSITKMIRARREILNKNKIEQFSKGDKVEFEHNGKTITGQITKVKIKRISVRTDQGLWDIPATLLNFST